MLNYIKSEFYRAAHSAEIRGTALGLGGIVLLMNLVLYLMKDLEHFRYGKDTPVPVDGFTRGHIKRGVE